MFSQARVFEGRHFHSQNAQLPFKKYCYHYGIQATILEKSSRHDEVIAQTVTFLKILSQNAPDCISAHIHFKTFLGGLPLDQYPRKLVAFGHSEPLPQKINPRQNPVDVVLQHHPWHLRYVPSRPDNYRKQVLGHGHHGFHRLRAELPSIGSLKPR